MGNYKSKRQNSMIISDYDLSIINKTEFEIIDLDIIEFINEKIILTKQYLNSKTYINTYDLSKKEQQLIHIYDDNVREILVSNNNLAIVSDTYITIYDFQKLLKNKKDEIFKHKIDKSCVVQLFDDYFIYYDIQQLGIKKIRLHLALFVCLHRGGFYQIAQDTKGSIKLTLAYERHRLRMYARRSGTRP